jgi:glycine/serine hydroxymethyltransferase
MEAYAAVLQPGDTILGQIWLWGHLTHDHHLISQQNLSDVPYGVTTETRRLTMTISKSWRRRKAEADHRRAEAHILDY